MVGGTISPCCPYWRAWTYHHVVGLEFPLALGASELVAVSGSHRAVSHLFWDVDAQYLGISGFTLRSWVVVGWFLISLWCGPGCGGKRVSVTWRFYLTNLEGAFSKASLHLSLQK